VRAPSPKRGDGSAVQTVGGAGLRAAQYLVLGAKARALLAGRAHVSVDDIRALTHATFRHRILINYRAEAEGINVERVIDRLLEHVR